jgi:hypothetical protein
VLAATTVAGVLTVAGPAMADVKVQPASVPQGSGQNVTFQVTNTGKCVVSRVKLVLPADQPIAEVYPLSVDDWAPMLTPLTLTTPLTSIHNGSPVTETASAVTWVAVKGKELAPGRTAGLPVALGPLPTTSSMSFKLEQTCADGKAGPAVPPVTLALTPAEPGQATGHSGHGGGATAPGGTSGGTTAEDDAQFAALIDAADDGPGFWTYAGWVLAVVGLAAALVMLLRGRRATAPDAGEPAVDDEDEVDDDKDPVGAGAAPRVTSWRYQDKPE